jgi:large subunit ribosomal protein L10
VADITQLRRKLREQKAECLVVKNTLATLAARKVDKTALEGLLKGPTAITFSYGEAVPTVKALLDYVKTTKSIMRIKGGVLGTRALSQAELSTLAALPPKEVLVAKMLGNLQAPLSGLMYTLTADLRGLMNVLNARIKQQEVSANVGS